MKKWLVVLGIGLVVAGLAGGTAGFALLDWDYRRLDTSGPYEQAHEMIPPDGLGRLVIQADNRRLEVGPSQDGNIHIQYYKVGSQEYTLLKSDETLTLRHSDPRPWHAFLSGGMFSDAASYPIRVELPDGLHAQVELATSNASIHMEGVQLDAGLKANTSNAGITTQDLSCTDAELTTDNAGVALRRAMTASLRIHTSNGKIELEDVKADDTILRTKNAEIGLTRLSATSVDAQTANAKIELDALSCPDIRLRNENAKIEGTIAGSRMEYLITAHTTNAACNVDNMADTSAQKLLDARTSNAKIDLYFEDMKREGQ